MPGPDELHAAALRHLARFSATQAGLVRVLERRVQRWVRAAELEGVDTVGVAAAGRSAAQAVARALVEAGLIDDAVFATARARRLARSGRSSRAVSAHLASKGVPAETIRSVLDGPEEELSAAVAFARRRRIGPFRPESLAEGEREATHARELGALARAGFGRGVAEQALALPFHEAEALVLAFKRG